MENTSGTIAGEENKKHEFDIKRAEISVSAGCLITGILFSFLAFPGCFRLGWTIVFAFYIIVCSIYLRENKNKVSAYPIICVSLSLALAVNFWVSANNSVNFFSIILMIILATLWFSSLAGKSAPSNDIGYIKDIISDTFGTIPSLPITAKSILNAGKNKNNKIKKIIVGILCAFPLVCVIISLLMNSDDAFYGLISTITDSLSYLIIKVIGTIIVTPLLINYIMVTKNNAKQESATSDEKSIDNIILIAFSALMSAVYVVYIISQFAYFFSAFSSVLPEGYNFSYAEYARKGFFEMCAVACINLIVVFLLITFSKKISKKMNGALKSICIFICTFTILLISTALSKMVMYIVNFGMTQLRICTSSFMVFLLIVFVAMIVKCCCLNVNVVKLSLPLAAVFLIVLGFGNVDSAIAKYNYEAFVSGKLETVDIQYLNELGPAGIPYLIRIYNNDCGKCTNDLMEYSKNVILAWVYEYYDGEFETIDESGSEKFIINARTYKYFYEMNRPLKIAYKTLDTVISRDSSLLTIEAQPQEFDFTSPKTTEPFTEGFSDSE